MNRRKFIKQTCTACLALTVIPQFLSSCATTKYLSGTLEKDGLSLPIANFKIDNKKGEVLYHKFIIIRNEELQFPICIFRINESEYSALWMECTHQGAELQATGDYLQCTAHGSEFDNKGKVLDGPADKNLRSFPVSIQNQNLFIDLRKA